MLTSRFLFWTVIAVILGLCVSPIITIAISIVIIPIVKTIGWKKLVSRGMSFMLLCCAIILVIYGLYDNPTITKTIIVAIIVIPVILFGFFMLIVKGLSYPYKSFEKIALPFYEKYPDAFPSKEELIVIGKKWCTQTPQPMSEEECFKNGIIKIMMAASETESEMGHSSATEEGFAKYMIEQREQWLKNEQALLDSGKSTKE